MSGTIRRKMKQIKINRWHATGEVSMQHWKDLISSLALCGYEIYADDDNIVFTLGCDDSVKEVE